MTINKTETQRYLSFVVVGLITVTIVLLLCIEFMYFSSLPSINDNNGNNFIIGQRISNNVFENATYFKHENMTSCFMLVEYMALHSLICIPCNEVPKNKKIYTYIDRGSKK